jgi:hypothetical protein
MTKSVGRSTVRLRGIIRYEECCVREVWMQAGGVPYRVWLKLLWIINEHKNNLQFFTTLSAREVIYREIMFKLMMFRQICEIKWPTGILFWNTL